MYQESEKKSILGKIAEAFLGAFSSIYIVNTDTNEYQWYSINADFNSLEIEQTGRDFFADMAENVRKVIYEEDWHIFEEDFRKEALLEGIKARQIGGACLDVYEEEADLFFRDYSGHIISDDTLARLISMPNVIVTSHQAFLTEEALHAIAETTLNNLREFSATGVCANELCYRCGKIEQCMKSKNKKCF